MKYTNRSTHVRDKREEYSEENVWLGLETGSHRVRSCHAISSLNANQRNIYVVASRYVRSVILQVAAAISTVVNLFFG